MRIIVTGGRDYTGRPTVQKTLVAYDDVPKPTLVHGDASGADRLAAQVADMLGWTLEPHPADWPNCRSECPKRHRRRNRSGRWYCPRAGRIRNQHMAELGADTLIAFPGGSGTANMVKHAHDQNIPVHHVTELGENC